MNWRIYYDDREPYSSADGGPETAPACGVQVIVQEHKAHGHEYVTGADYYVWRDGRWWGADQFGMYDYLIMPGWKVVLFGRMIAQEKYNAIVREANAKKTGWRPGERRVA